MSDLPLCLFGNFQRLVPIRILIYRGIYQGPLFTAMLICDDYGDLMGQGNGVKSPHSPYLVRGRSVGSPQEA